MNDFLVQNLWLPIILIIFSAALSQLPPMKNWRKRKLNVKTLGKLTLNHFLGIPKIHMYISLKNTGGRSINVESIEATISEKNGKIFSLQGLYFSPTNTNFSYYLTNIELAPDQEWNNNIQFTKELSTSIKKEQRQIIKDMRKNINSRQFKSTEPSNSWLDLQKYETSPENLSEAKKFFEEHFIWNVGEYTLSLNFKCTDPVKDISKNFTFIIYDADENELKDHTEFYKKGAGIINFTNKSLYYPQIDLTPIDK